MNTTETFLIAMRVIFTVPWLVWRLGRTDHVAPLVVVPIVTGILLGPGVLGAAFPDDDAFAFNPQVIGALNGVAGWAVMLFVFIAGIELDLRQAWRHRRESGVAAGLALGMPLLLGCGAALALLSIPGWVGAQARSWQFVLGIGMACAVTALPILILLMEKLDILRRPIGQCILRRLMPRLREADRWYFGLVWLLLMAVAGTMLTVPMVTPMLERLGTVLGRVR